MLRLRDIFRLSRSDRATPRLRATVDRAMVSGALWIVMALSAGASIILGLLSGLVRALLIGLWVWLVCMLVFFGWRLMEMYRQAAEEAETITRGERPCGRCGYPLVAEAPTCPECGAPAGDSDR